MNLRLLFDAPRATLDAALLRKELATALGAEFGEGWGGVVTDQQAEIVLFPARAADASLVAPVVQAHIDAAPARAAAAAAAALADTEATAYASTNAVVTYLATHTPEECAAYVNAQVVDLASAKAMLSNFAIALAVLVRRAKL